MVLSVVPFCIVAVSTGAYSRILCLVRRRWPPRSITESRAQLKAISAAHATLMALLAATVLTRPLETTRASDQSLRPPPSRNANLDDTANPIIQGRSRAANAITAWETGYLLYDTGALFLAVPGARVSSTFVAHHLLLVSALLYLQLYIAQARERGMWVINNLLLMNATNPLLHARWWYAKRGKVPYAFDALFVVLFGASRFGLVAWILHKYGSYHGLGPLEAFTRLRIPCKVGTTTPVGLNGAWWALLVKSLITRSLKRPGMRAANPPKM